jgi:tetratricopeptide (TPR) repeat protein
MLDVSRKQERKNHEGRVSLLRWLVLALFSTGFVAGAAGAEAQCDIDSLLSAGNKAYEAFDNETALSAYQKAYDECPGSYEAFMKTTRAHIDLGEDVENSDRKQQLFEQALDLSEKLREAYPDSMMPFFLTSVVAANLAQLSGGRRKVDLAHTLVDNIERAIELDSTYSPSYVVLGAYQREVATASEILKTISRLFFGGVPDGTLEESERNITKALELDPNNLYAHLQLAKTYLELDRTREAREHLREVERLPVTTHQGDELKKEARELLGSTPSTSAR